MEIGLDMEQLTGTKSRKEYEEAVNCHPAYLPYWRVHHAKCLDGWLSDWNEDCQEKYQPPQMCSDTTLITESLEELKNLLMQVKEESEKAGLKLSIQKLRSKHSVSSLPGK